MNICVDPLLIPEFNGRFILLRSLARKSEPQKVDEICPLYLTQTGRNSKSWLNTIFLGVMPERPIGHP
jgi:hypothetical protein